VAETTEELVLDIGAQLTALVSRELPMTVSRSAPVPRRTMIALTAKTTAIMRGVLDLIEKNRLPEVMILGRSLADHVITLAWIAADVDGHYPRWEKEDAKHRLGAHKHWEESGRGRLLEPDAVVRYERILSVVSKFPPDMRECAEQADAFWARRLGFPAGDQPFSDAYMVIFRHSSSRTHASLQGLNDVLEATPEHNVIHLDRLGEPLTGVLRAILMVFGLGLVVSASTNGFPSRGDVESVVSEFLRRRAALSH
jgi:hypothetical protein